MTLRAKARRESITPEWTLGRLQASFPGVELALFAFFGVGSRERAGFSAAEKLGDLLRRHLVFDSAQACAKLDALAAEDWQHSLTPIELAARLQGGTVAVVDARSACDHALCRIKGSVLLSAPCVAGLRQSSPEAVTVVCNDGSQAPAAARHLRGLGIPAGHLEGGLRAWAQEVDPTFPILFPLSESPGRWHLLADGRSLRFRRVVPSSNTAWRIWDRLALLAHPSLSALAKALPELELLASTPKSFLARGDFPDLHDAIAVLEVEKLVEDHGSQGALEPDSLQEELLLNRVLSQEAPKILQSHKGTVEIESYRDRVLTLRLGGGCAGCASAQITTQRELAAALYREVPLLDSVVSLS